VAGRYRIGQVAKAAGLGIKAIRFYESRGLLPRAERTGSGYRVYSAADLHRLEFIKQAKALGLRLGEIRELAVTARERTCSMTRPKLLRVLDEQLSRTSRQIKTLAKLRRELQRRRRLLMSRPPTNHGQGYCGCLEDGPSAAPQLLEIERR
jgi:DNA-binding transcriptional MerR regulator